MSIGERGPSGDHGQAGDPGRHGEQGVKGEKGERGKPGITPLAVRQANKAFVGLTIGIFATLGIFAHQERQNDERDARQDQIFEQEAINTDRAFCAFANQTRSEINRNRQALRDTQAALRTSFNLALAPRPEESEADNERRAKLLTNLLATLNAAPINGNLPLIDCSGIGDGKLNFSIQDALTPTTSTP